MEIYGFNLDDLNKLETLLQISKEISDIYDKLCELEINNQKDSNEYNKLLIELKILIEKEKKEYQKKKFTHEECIKYLKLLETSTFIPSMDNRVTTTLKHNKNKIVRRIMIKLTSILNETKGFHQRVYNIGEKLGLTNIIDGITKEELLKGIENSTKIENAIEKDIHSIFLSILEEAISYKSNDKHRKELIKAKYCILFSHMDMESMFINQDFNIPKTIYTTSKMINQLLNEAELAYKHIKYMKLKAMANHDINSLLNLFDIAYEKENIAFNSIITSCHIRALLSLMDSEDVDNFNQEIHDILDSPKYLEKHSKDRISESIVISCFKYFKKDREKIRTLSAKN